MNTASHSLWLLLFIVLWVATIAQEHGIPDPSKNPINPSSFKAAENNEYNYVVIYRGYLFSSSGYGQEARAYIKGLLAIGVPVSIDQQEPELINVPTITKEDNALLQRLVVKDPARFAQEKRKQNKIVIAIHHTVPQHVNPAPWADYNIARTMWEMHDLPSAWVPGLLALDEIWVPSKFNKQTFSAAGIPESKLFVVGECLDDEYYSPAAVSSSDHIILEGSRRVNFFSMFNWNYRKGWDILVEAFAREFKPNEDVALHIKCFSSWGKTRDYFKAETLRVLREKGIATSLPPNIIFLNAAWDEGQMPYVYKAFDAFLMPTRAEGWGRPTMEAMLSGVPVITTKYSGQEEFVNNKNAFVIPHTIVDVPKEAIAEVEEFAGGKWAEPSVAEMQKLMRQVIKSPKDAKKRAGIAQNFISKNFSSQKIASAMRDRMGDIAKKRGKTK